jgi:hypothetical protein
MSGHRLAPRLRRLATAAVLGREVPVASGALSRLLGLACLERERAGGGLLIPRCASVHTFGMRFPLDLYFLQAGGAVVSCRLAVPPRRLASCRAASAVLEIPSEQGGEFAPPAP